MKGIRFENVSKYYKEGDRTFTALNKVSISVEPGEFVAVIGPSGSGKSTFLSIAGALLKPSEGNVDNQWNQFIQFKAERTVKITP